MTSITRTHPTTRYGLAFVLLALLVSALSSAPRAASAAGETATITIMGSTAPPGFSPSLLSIHVYDTVVFVNQSSPASSYAVSANDGSFASPAIPPNQQWRVTFNSAGVHEFHAVSATQRMIGEILVLDNAVNLLPTPIPAVNATVVALIQAGHTPPDTLGLASPTPTTIAKRVIQQSSAPPLPLFIGATLLAVLLLGGLGYLLVRLRRRRGHRGRGNLPEDEEEGADETLSAVTIPMRMGKERKAQPAPVKQVQGTTPLLRLRRVQVQENEDEDDE